MATSEEARQHWVRRQLCNDRRHVAVVPTLGGELVGRVAGRSVRLILDPTDLAANLTIVQITLAYRGRALPLAWLTTYVKPGTVKDAIRLCLPKSAAGCPRMPTYT